MPAHSYSSRKNSKTFWHPDSRELILTAAAATAVFTLWNSINIRPAWLTDPKYKPRKEAIRHHMNLTLVAILGISAGIVAIYGKRGCIPAAAAAGTGITMYLWTNAELNRDVVEVIPLVNDLTGADSSSLRIRTNYPELYKPMGATT